MRHCDDFDAFRGDLKKLDRPLLISFRWLKTLADSKLKATSPLQRRKSRNWSACHDLVLDCVLRWNPTNFKLSSDLGRRERSKGTRGTPESSSEVDGPGRLSEESDRLLRGRVNRPRSPLASGGKVASILSFCTKGQWRPRNERSEEKRQCPSTEGSFKSRSVREDEADERTHPTRAPKHHG